MNNSISSIENPILFFQDLLNYRSLENMINDFKDHSLFDHFDNSTLTAIDYEIDSEGKWNKLEYKFAQYLSNKLKDETIISIKLIDLFLRPNFEETISLNKIKNLLDILYSLSKNISKSLPPKVQHVIRRSLIEIIHHVFKQYEILGIAHPSRTLIQQKKEINLSFSFFGAVKENFDFYRALHSIFYDNDIIPESEEDDNAFFNLLISEKPQDLGVFISFSVSNRQAAMILRSISPFFKNFNFNTIGESGCFLKKNNSSFNKQDLETALSEAKRYFKDNPRKMPNHRIQSTIDWINDQKSNYLICT